MKFLRRDLRTFSADFFVTEKQTPQTFSLLECMVLTRARTQFCSDRGSHSRAVILGHTQKTTIYLKKILFSSSIETLQNCGWDFAFSFWGKWAVNWIGFSGSVGFGLAANFRCRSNDALQKFGLAAIFRCRGNGALQKLLTKVQNQFKIDFYQGFIQERLESCRNNLDLVKTKCLGSLYFSECLYQMLWHLSD